MHGVQVTLEGGLAADRHRLRPIGHRPVIKPPGGIVQPLAGSRAEVFHQPGRVAGSQLGNGQHAQFLQSFVGLGADAVDAAAGQGPDPRLQILGADDRDAVRLVQIAGHLGDQLVGGHPDRAAQPGFGLDARLQPRGQRTSAVLLNACHLRQVDEHLVDAPILHHRCFGQDDRLEGLREAAVPIEIGWQQDGLRAQVGAPGQPHARTQPELPGSIGGGGGHASAPVVAQPGEMVRVDGLQCVRSPWAARMALVDVGHQFLGCHSPAADHHRQGLQLRILQQRHRGEESIHVQMGDAS